MKNRLRYENELVDFLTRRGYACCRSPRSRGPFDVFAVNAGGVRLIQVKSTYDFDRKGNLSVFKAAIKQLHALRAPSGVAKELWVRVLRSGWRYIVVNNSPNDDAGLREYLKSVEWIEAI